MGLNFEADLSFYGGNEMHRLDEKKSDTNWTHKSRERFSCRFDAFGYQGAVHLASDCNLLCCLVVFRDYKLITMFGGLGVEQ